MSLRWCGLTAALIGLAVAATLVQLAGTSEEPGITRRWWDGTLEKQERRWSDGRLAQRTFYGEDGQSLLRDEIYDYSTGALTSLSVRLADGTMETSTYSVTDHRLLTYKLKTPDQRFTLINREYYPDGKLRLEQISSKDGQIILEDRKWFVDGSLEREEKVLPSGEQQLVIYWRKDVLKVKQRLLVNGTGERLQYRSDGKTIERKRVDSEESAVIEEFLPDGSLAMTEYHDRKTGYITFTVYDTKGKVRFKQGWKPFNQRSAILETVEIFDENGKLERKLYVNGRRVIHKADHFRPDGTVSSKRTLRPDGTVSQEEFFDEKGNLTETKQYGKNEVEEKIDEEFTRLLQKRENDE